MESARGPVTEWFVDGPLGVEHGFTLASPPACAGYRLVLSVSVEGLVPRMDKTGRGVELCDGGGEVQLHYTDLVARDARRRTLPSAMTVEDSAVALRVDAHEAAFPIVVDPVLWVQQSVLSDNGFGQAVAVTSDTILLGDYIYPYLTRAYVAVNNGSSWSTQWLQSGSDAGIADKFASSVSVSGDTALIGAPGLDPGAAYVFVRSGSTWTQQGPALSPSNAAAHKFGASVSLSGDTALIGAPASNYYNPTYAGEAYVFVRNGSTWMQQGPPLTPSERQLNDDFGVAVSLSGDTAVVTADYETIGSNTSQGAAYVFVRSGSTWTQQGSALVASDGAANDELGTSVSVVEDTVIIGGPNRIVGGARALGEAYVFVRNGSTWAQQGPPLTANDGTAGDYFGSSVSLYGDAALIGAAFKDVGTNNEQGAAYLFVRTCSQWTQLGPALTASDGASLDRFGWSVSLWGTTAAIGASAAGKAYIFTGGPAGDAGFSDPDATASCGSDASSDASASMLDANANVPGNDAAATTDSGTSGDDAASALDANMPGNDAAAPSDSSASDDDSGPTVDASAESVDGGARDASGPDAGMQADSRDAGHESSGCGCRTITKSARTADGWFVLCALLALRRRRSGSARSSRPPAL
jgi:hypothetical protein